MQQSSCQDSNSLLTSFRQKSNTDTVAIDVFAIALNTDCISLCVLGISPSTPATPPHPTPPKKQTSSVPLNTMTRRANAQLSQLHLKRKKGNLHSYFPVHKKHVHAEVLNLQVNQKSWSQRSKYTVNTYVGRNGLHTPKSEQEKIVATIK